ncbi:unnamed protein product [Mesocestoides corti]|uniref:K Homology domain-containing protein n=1 Tax=Mesocestoides corti TaxID=53468 RepID=A0A0R3UQN9_MESCO|nr:unnamed protein product [Mesocestoides corti]
MEGLGYSTVASDKGADMLDHLAAVNPVSLCVSMACEDDEQPTREGRERGPAPKRVAEGLPSFQPSVTTEVIEIPVEERRFQSNKSEDLVASDQSKVCAAIGKSLGVKIELTTSKNKSLNAIVTGLPAQVAKAKVMIIQDLQQQAQKIVKIPSEYHRFLIGPQGRRRRELEAATLTKIMIPPPGRNSTDIVITGSPSKLDAAEKEIRRVVDFYAQQGTERISVPKIFLPFIYGPYNRTITELKERTNTKITIPSTDSSNCDIIITGKKDDVKKALTEINNIYRIRSQRCATISVPIPPEKHCLVVGHRGYGLSEIFEKTNVVVEPPQNPDDEDFVLRGFPEDLGRATTMLYQQASSSATGEVTAPHRLHKMLIGKKGACLASICDGYQAVRVEFPISGDKIMVKGPPEEVSVVVDRLNTRVSELNDSHFLDFAVVDPKYRAKLLGDGPESLLQFIRNGRLNVRLPTPSECEKPANESHIFLEGKKTDVEMVKIEIARLVKKWQNEKVKDVIVDPHIQRLLRSGNPPPIFQIEKDYPEVNIVWPQLQSGVNEKQRNSPSAGNNTTEYVMQLCGVRDQVDAAFDKLSKLIRQIKEENHEEELRIFKDCLQRILGAPIVNLLKETKTRIRYLPPSTDGSQPVIIIGRQEDVDSAISRLEKLQKSMANIEETTITLPSLMFTKQAGDAATRGARLRSIREQCEGVQLKSSPDQPRQLTISGPPEALKKAKALIDSMCAKMLERCADTVVHADPKFHGQLIGRGGASLRKFREKHDVEVLFPDRIESDPKRASEIHIIGEKEAVAKAQNDLEEIIKAMEDEVDTTIRCDGSIVNDLWNYRNAFQYPELDRVKVIFPKGSNTPPTGKRNTEIGNSPHEDTVIRIFGAKGCVEDAEQCVLGIINEIKQQQQQVHLVTELSHCQVLSRLRSSLPDFQRNYGVLIRLQLNKDGFQESDDGQTVYGRIILTGQPEKISNVLKNEIIPRLPILEVVPFPHEFYGMLFSVVHPPHQPQSNNRQGRQPEQVRSGHRNQRERGGIAVVNSGEEGDAPRTKLNALQRKYNVTITVPPRAQQGVDQLTVRGAPDAVEACKAEILAFETQLQEAKADREARNYEESLDVEERFLSRIITNEKDRLLKQHGVAIFTRGRGAAGSPTTSNGEKVESAGASMHQPVREHLAGYRLVRSAPVPLVLQGYKEKVVVARRELEELIEKFGSFSCEELHIPSRIYARLIGTRRNNIRRIEETYNVEVEFPPRGVSGEAADIVLVMGAPSDVDRACDELINKANDLVSWWL